MARPRSEDARRRAIEAGVEVLLEVGFEGATVEDIAARSGVAKSTLYRHFGSRQALLGQAVRSCMEEAPVPDTGSLADDVDELFSHYDASDASQRLNELFPLLLDAARRDPTMKDVMQSILAERQRPLRAVLAQAQSRGEIDPDLDHDIALAMLIGPLTYRRMVQDRDITDDFRAVVLPGAVAALRSTAR